MKDDDESLPTTSGASNPNKESFKSCLFGKSRYKFYALAAILLLAFWSMFTGSVNLRWSAGDVNRSSDELDTLISDDLDVIEMDEMEKVVNQMWEVYTNSRRISLPKFWQEAFEVGYEELPSDVAGVRESAIAEIAKMSVRSLVLDIDPLPAESTSAHDFSMSWNDQ